MGYKKLVLFGKSKCCSDQDSWFDSIFSITKCIYWYSHEIRISFVKTNYWLYNFLYLIFYRFDFGSKIDIYFKYVKLLSKKKLNFL